MGHVAMWLSVFGGIGIILGLVTAALVFRRRRAAACRAQDPGADSA